MPIQAEGMHEQTLNYFPKLVIVLSMIRNFPMEHGIMKGQSRSVFAH